MNYVLFHAGCMDGLFSAYTVWSKYGEENWTYIPVKYQEPLPDLINPQLIYIVDFSYNKETLKGLSRRCIRLFVIDHHSTAKEELLSFKNELNESGAATILFENSKCGCVLTYNHCFPDIEIPELLSYVQDRDLWKWEWLNSREINEGLRNKIKFHEDILENFKRIDHLLEYWAYEERDLLYMEGKGILNYKDELVNSVAIKVENKQWVIGSYRYKVGTVNCGVYDLVSEVGNAILLKNQDLHFSMVYTYSIDNGWNVSLRGMDRKDEYGDDIHVGNIAKSLGGGGHKNASSFKTSDNLFFLEYLIHGFP